MNPSFRQEDARVFRVLPGQHNNRRRPPRLDKFLVLQLIKPVAPSIGPLNDGFVLFPDGRIGLALSRLAQCDGLWMLGADLRTSTVALN